MIIQYFSSWICITDFGHDGEVCEVKDSNISDFCDPNVDKYEPVKNKNARGQSLK